MTWYLKLYWNYSTMLSDSNWDFKKKNTFLLWLPLSVWTTKESRISRLRFQQWQSAFVRYVRQRIKWHRLVIDWLTDWLTEWLTDWLHWLHWLSDCTDWLADQHHLAKLIKDAPTESNLRAQAEAKEAEEHRKLTKQLMWWTNASYFIP